MRSRFQPRITLLLLLVVLTAIATPLVAAAAAKGSPTVDEIVDLHVQAKGGLDKIRAIRTLVYSGGVYREADFESPGDAFMAFARPYYKVVGNPEAEGGFFGFMEGYDGAAWEWFADPGIVIRTVGAAAGAGRRGADFEGALVDYRAKGTTVVLGEPASIGGRPAWRLTATLRDGFKRVYFVDQETHLLIAERRSAPFHAFGDPVTSETRIGDYREVDGVFFAHSYVQTDIATGERMSEMAWGRIEANRDLPRGWFSPPEFDRTPLQRFLEQLYLQRTDREAVLWSYHEFRRFHPEVDTRDGVELIGYQMLKMGEAETAVALLEANLADHPGSASSAYELGRAYRGADRRQDAARTLRRALELDPEHGRARRVLEELEAEPAAGPDLRSTPAPAPTGGLWHCG